VGVVWPERPFPIKKESCLQNIVGVLSPEVNAILRENAAISRNGLLIADT
jgi:hypothetical protein